MASSNNHRRFATKPVALLVAAHPIWNVPPFVNAAEELARHGYAVLVIGYQSKGLARYERIGPGAWILRLPLLSRRIRWAGLRKVFATMEFLLGARALTSRLRPNVLITFNDPAAILQNFTGPPAARTRVSWLLEFPELERLNILSRLFFHYSASCWAKAHILVVPTRERLALHLALRPECGNHRTLVVQNAPNNRVESNEVCSNETETALRFLRHVEPNTLRVVYAGAIGNRYAIDSLIRAAGSFSKGVRVLLLGQKHNLAKAEVNEALAQTNYPKNICWIDEIPYRELATVLDAADIGFASYRGDSLNTRFSAPGKLYEYLKNGLAILSDDECCIEAEVAGAGCGFLFPYPVSDRGIHAALAEFLEHRKEVETMKRSARRLFETRLNMENQMASLIPELTGSGQDQPSVEDLLGQPDLSHFPHPTKGLPETPRYNPQ